MLTELACPPVGFVPTFASARRCAAWIGVVQRLLEVPPADVAPRVAAHHSEVVAREALRHVPPDAARWLTALRRRVVATAEDWWGIRGLGLEFTLFTELREGGQHVLHADNERPDGRGGWEPNHTPYRTCTGMLYLNTCGRDFTGGEIYFPRCGVTVPPAVGTLVLLDCRRDHEHGVHPVQRGVRYALSLWMTASADHYEEWPG